MTTTNNTTMKGMIGIKLDNSIGDKCRGRGRGRSLSRNLPSWMTNNNGSDTINSNMDDGDDGMLKNKIIDDDKDNILHNDNNNNSKNSNNSSIYDNENTDLNIGSCIRRRGIATSTPWYNSYEFDTVGRDLLLSSTLLETIHTTIPKQSSFTTTTMETISKALERISIWRIRSTYDGGRLPLSVEATSSLAEIVLRDFGYHYYRQHSKQHQQHSYNHHHNHYYSPN